MIDSIYQDTQESMEKAIAALKKELKRVRTGRASLSLLDGIKVDYYGTLTPVNQLATLAVPESRLITIQPWDVSVIKEIEKAVLKSDLGLTPTSDGKIVRIAIPSVSASGGKTRLESMMCTTMASPRRSAPATSLCTRVSKRDPI